MQYKYIIILLAVISTTAAWGPLGPYKSDPGSPVHTQNVDCRNGCIVTPTMSATEGSKKLGTKTVKKCEEYKTCPGGSRRRRGGRGGGCTPGCKRYSTKYVDVTVTPKYSTNPSGVYRFGPSPVAHKVHFYYNGCHQSAQCKLGVRCGPKGAGTCPKDHGFRVQGSVKVEHFKSPGCYDPNDPCQQGGTCAHELSGTEYEAYCICKPGTWGARCQYVTCEGLVDTKSALKDLTPESFCNNNADAKAAGKKNICDGATGTCSCEYGNAADPACAPCGANMDNTDTTCTSCLTGARFLKNSANPAYYYNTKSKKCQECPVVETHVNGDKVQAYCGLRGTCAGKMAEHQCKCDQGFAGKMCEQDLYYHYYIGLIKFMEFDHEGAQKNFIDIAGNLDCLEIGKTFPKFDEENDHNAIIKRQACTSIRCVVTGKDPYCFPLNAVPRANPFKHDKEGSVSVENLGRSLQLMKDEENKNEILDAIFGVAARFTDMTTVLSNNEAISSKLTDYKLDVHQNLLTNLKTTISRLKDSSETIFSEFAGKLPGVIRQFNTYYQEEYKKLKDAWAREKALGFLKVIGQAIGVLVTVFTGSPLGALAAGALSFEEIDSKIEAIDYEHENKVRDTRLQESIMIEVVNDGDRIKRPLSERRPMPPLERQTGSRQLVPPKNPFKGLKAGIETGTGLMDAGIGLYESISGLIDNDKSFKAKIEQLKIWLDAAEEAADKFKNVFGNVINKIDEMSTWEDTSKGLAEISFLNVEIGTYQYYYDMFLEGVKTASEEQHGEIKALTYNVVNIMKETATVMQSAFDIARERDLLLFEQSINNERAALFKDALYQQASKDEKNALFFDWRQRGMLSVQLSVLKHFYIIYRGYLYHMKESITNPSKNFRLSLTKPKDQYGGPYYGTVEKLQTQFSEMKKKANDYKEKVTMCLKHNKIFVVKHELTDDEKAAGFADITVAMPPKASSCLEEVTLIDARAWMPLADCNAKIEPECITADDAECPKTTSSFIETDSFSSSILDDEINNKAPRRRSRTRASSRRAASRRSSGRRSSGSRRTTRRRTTRRTTPGNSQTCNIKVARVGNSIFRKNGNILTYSVCDMINSVYGKGTEGTGLFSTVTATQSQYKNSKDRKSTCPFFQDNPSLLYDLKNDHGHSFPSLYGVYKVDFSNKKIDVTKSTVIYLELVPSFIKSTEACDAHPDSNILTLDQIGITDSNDVCRSSHDKQMKTRRLKPCPFYEELDDVKYRFMEMFEKPKALIDRSPQSDSFLGSGNVPETLLKVKPKKNTKPKPKKKPKPSKQVIKRILCEYNCSDTIKKAVKCSKKTSRRSSTRRTSRRSAGRRSTVRRTTNRRTTNRRTTRSSFIEIQDFSEMLRTRPAGRTTRRVTRVLSRARSAARRTAARRTAARRATARRTRTRGRTSGSNGKKKKMKKGEAKSKGYRFVKSWKASNCPANTSNELCIEANTYMKATEEELLKPTKEKCDKFFLMWKA